MITSAYSILSPILKERGFSIAEDENCLQPWIEVSPEHLRETFELLKTDPRFYFDQLECVTGLDRRDKEKGFQVVYHLTSIPRGHQIAIKCSAENPEKPELPTVSDLYRTAEWHERETWDLLGIRFSGHPDLRRMLMPEDWEGHPLRKDYADPESYHDVKVKY